MSKLVTTISIIVLRSCYGHRPLFAGFSTWQVPRWSLTCIYQMSYCISSALATDELNSVQFCEAKASFPFSYTHIHTCLRRHVKHFYIQQYPIRLFVRLPGEYLNIEPDTTTKSGRNPATAVPTYYMVYLAPGPVYLRKTDAVSFRPTAWFLWRHFQLI